MASSSSIGAPELGVAARTGTFRALQHRNYKLFFIGQGISQIGTWMQMIAQQWLIYRLTGSMVMLGLISAVGLIPLVPLSLWGGAIADRLPRRWILVGTQSAMLVQAMMLAALSWTGHVQVWHVMVLAVFLSACNALNMPAQMAFVVEMVDGKEDLTSAIGLNSALMNGSRVVGPALAGIAVAVTGEAGAFFVNGLSFLAVIVALIMMRLKPYQRSVRRTSAAAQMIEGARYIGKQHVILVLISLVAVSSFLSMPYGTLLPVFATKILAPSAKPLLDLVCTGKSALFNCQSPDALTYGLLQAGVGVGAVLGALFVASLSAKARRGRWLTLGNIMFPALLVAFAVSRSFALDLVILAMVGFSFVFQNALANTLLQLTTPDELRGRVMSFWSLAMQGFQRMGGMQAGAMGDWLGAPLAVGIGAVASLAYGIFVAVRYPKVRNLA